MHLLAVCRETVLFPCPCLQHAGSSPYLGRCHRRLTQVVWSLRAKHWRPWVSQFKFLPFWGTRTTLSAGDQEQAVFMSASAAHVNQKKTIRGLLGHWKSLLACSAPALSLCHSSKQSGALSHLIKLTRGPFLCCFCHACPIPFSCLTASPYPLWKCAN